MQIVEGTKFTLGILKDMRKIRDIIITNFKNMHCYYMDNKVAQWVKNLPAMQETWVQLLGWEDPLEKAWQPTLVFLPGEFHGQRSLVGYSPYDCKELDTTEATERTHTSSNHHRLV